jgi:hypothetical protein
MSKLAICLGVMGIFAAGQAVAATPATVTYTYDSLGRLHQDKQAKNESVYIYDNAGNRIRATTTTK